MAQILAHNTANDTAGGYYVVLWHENLSAWKPGSSALGTYTNTRDDFDVQASGGGTHGRWSLTVPAIPVGYYFWSWFKEASVGTRSHANDTQVATGDSYWNGIAFTTLQPEFYTTNSLVSQTVVSFGIGPSKDNALLGYTVRISSATAGEDSGFTSCVRKVTAHSWAADVHSVTLDSAPIFTLAGGETLEFYPPFGLQADIQDQLDDIETTVAAITGGGPVNHAKVPKARILPVKSRGDGTVGVIGSVRMKADETLWWAVDCAGSMLAAGDTLDSMAEPTISGAEAANASVGAYGVLGTLAKFRIELDAAADTTDTINIELNLTPESGESLLITVPVTVVE